MKNSKMKDAMESEYVEEYLGRGLRGKRIVVCPQFLLSLIAILVLMLSGCGDHGSDNQERFGFANLLKKAAGGDASAQFAVGEAYANISGVPTEAVEWYAKATEQDFADAKSTKDTLFFNPFDNSDGVPKDAVKAAEWLRKAAEQGHAGAQARLGWIYAEGDGVPKNDAKALEWLRKAAEQGDAFDQRNLGWMYAKGDGVPKDATKAVEWYTKAAEQGDAQAQNNLGWMYDHGDGVSKDLVRAYVWYNLAAAHGNEVAKKNRDLAERDLTPAQRVEGQRLAAHWKPGDTLAPAGDAPAD